MIVLELRDGNTPCWQENVGHPWTEYKHLPREQFEELVDLMMEAYPEHELTRWLMRGFCINDGDSTISVGSLEGKIILNHHLSMFDEEDAECYEQFWEDADDSIDWDEDWEDEDT